MIVFNNSRVRKARLIAESETGGRVEFLLLKPEGPAENSTDDSCSVYFSWLAMVSKTKKQRLGKRYRFPGGIEGEIIEARGAERVVRFSEAIGDPWLDLHGHIPLPPYIRREDSLPDADRYQTVYSKNSGSVAAPTAGLHFTPELIRAIEESGVDCAYISLHVGRGTFLPVRTDDIREHKMHSEEYEISVDNAEKINSAVAEGKKILAVGTTSVRTLESEASRIGRAGVEPGVRSTDIFIYPGYEFQTVSHMLTNFHTPESSLLMLVSAFAGKDNIDRAYEVAIENKYRFFSYGDAMLIL